MDDEALWGADTSEGSHRIRLAEIEQHQRDDRVKNIALKSALEEFGGDVYTAAYRESYDRGFALGEREGAEFAAAILAKLDNHK